MACLLTTGRNEPCLDAIGGLKAVYFFDRLTDPFTVSAGEATAMNASLTDAYEYDLISDNSNLTENIVSDQNNGTTTNTQTLVLSLKKQDKDTAAQIALLAKAAPQAVIKDRAGNYRAVGISDGLTLNGNIESGGAKADFNGYNLTFTAIEINPAPFLDSSTVTAFEAVISATKITP